MSIYSQYLMDTSILLKALNLMRLSASIFKFMAGIDRDCMNTRHEILKSQAISAVKLSPNGCYVSMGVWVDPFSAMTFTRASDLDVDHIIPLKWAHDHGGNIWSAEKKEQFANDPENLIAVDDGLNQSTITI